jgi:cytochrome c
MMFRAAAFAFVTVFSLALVGCGDPDSPRTLPSEGGEGGVSSGSGAASAAGGAGNVAMGGGGNAALAGAATGGGGAAAAGAAAGGAGSLAAGGAAGGSSSGGAEGRAASLLIFSKTAGYRHDSIPAGIQGLSKLAAEQGWTTTATEDASRFSDAELPHYDAVIFLSTTGDVLSVAQQAAFERFIRGGHGFVGIHAATDTEYDWPWYGELVGAYFREHPAVQAADILIEDATDGATAGLPTPWHRTDEWYSFKSNPRPNVHVLLALDETSYAPGSSSMSGDHPIAWRHEHDGGRAFYTALGHTSESYSDPLFLGHVAGGIAWVLGQ